MSTLMVLPNAIDGWTNLFVVNERKYKVVFREWYFELGGIRISPSFKSEEDRLFARRNGFRAETDDPKDQEWLKEVVYAINEQSYAVSTKGYLLEG